MSMKDCILAKAAAGAVDQDLAQQAATLFDELETEALQRMSPADAEAFAARRAGDIAAAELGRKRANMARQIRIAEGIRAQIENFKTLKGKPDPGQGALAVLARDPRDRAGFEHVEGRYQSVLAWAHALSEALISELRPRLAGLKRNHVILNDVVRELAGEDTGDAMAQVLAKAWRDTSEALRVRFNAAGGNIAKRVDWIMPQKHDALTIQDAGFAAWRDFIRPKLDRGQIIDNLTGAPMTDGRLDILLTDIFETITTQGWSKRQPAMRAFGLGATANRRQDPRVLIFNNADDWMTYQRQFGSPDLHDTLISHINDMAMDIARLEVLGPNPTAMVAFMQQVVDKSAAGKGRRQQRAARVAIKSITRVDDELTGKALIPLRDGIANGFTATRNLLISAQLGSAAITAISDIAFQRLARHFNGLPAMGAVIDTLKLMNPADIADQRAAVRMGLTADNWIGLALGQARFAGDVIGPKWSKMMSDVVLRASGLSSWTQAGRWAFGMEFLSHLADFAGRTLDDMPVPTRNALARYGVTEADWARVTASALTDHKGVNFVDIQQLYREVPDVANRLHHMVLSEMEFAVPTSNARSRALLRFGTQRGTLIGEVAASIAMYKTFPVSIVHLHVMRGLSQATPVQKIAYLTDLVVSTTVLGALALQAKDISKGRDPRDMNSVEFMGAAFVQGGGAGIWGDFLFADVNRSGHGTIVTAAGPLVGLGEDVIRLTLGNVQQAGITGDKTNIGREAARFFERYFPGSSLWYARLGLERALFDRLQQLADPDARQDFRRIERAAQRDRGQKFFWRPGQAAPSRLPDLLSAFGGEL